MKQQAKIASPIQDSLTGNEQSLKDTINKLAEELFPRQRKKQEQLVAQLWEMGIQAHGKDFLVIHSPGGWGNTQWEDLLDWEKSIVTGVTATLEKLGYTWIMKQYFRSGDTLWGGKDVFKEAQFFLAGVSYRAEVLAEELKFITQSLPKLKVVLVGASQGAAFNNTAMMKVGNLERIYSIELGTFFPHMPRRQLTERILAIDSNGLMRDPMCNRDLWVGTRAYAGAFYRWFKYRALGNPTKFTNCINTPGHEYKWEYPAVHGRITEFLTAKFGEKR
ncbi:MAG: hypothetical protein NTX46_00710 [Chloroflexi bacterium]|nr:hypothetical protein [Chloroflexota bacterium]